MERVALLAHGAGSSPDVVARLLGPCVPAGATVLAPALRGDVESSTALLERIAAEHQVVLAGGISLGAHALAILAASTGAPWPLVLAMPAWTGAPGPVAAATAAAADEVARLGRAEVLARLRADPATAEDWVLEELTAGWAAYDDDALAETLSAAASSRGPAPEELGRIQGPTALVALDGDPLHPRTVAEVWDVAIPRTALRVVGRHAPWGERGALGSAAADALRELSGSR
ncbi:MAG TPA: hypothetical protein VFL59_07445 [Candidatus Nanopelagicales bacterium]|nr:hypothetical protein [Candidatus Nanopelagicales bacterium]